MAARAPIIEIVIRDEVTAAMERLRHRTRSGVEQASFKNITTGIKSIEEGVSRLANTVQRELGSLLRVTGAGAFLGGGVVAGIVKATQALSNLARSAEQTRYTAEQLGLTEEVFKNLIARGKALGMSAEQTKGGLTSLATNLRELKVLGQNSAVYKQLVREGGASGQRFGDMLIAQVRGPGGIESGIQQFATSLAGVNQEAQSKLAGIFGVGSVAFRDLFSKGLADLPKILSLPEGEARRLNMAMARLNIQFDNMKVTLGSAVIPMFAQLTTTISNFLQGPGGKLVKQAADWFKALNIDWKSLGDGFVKVVGWLKDAFIATYNAYLIMDPIVQGMGGWTPILLGLTAAIGIGGAFTGRVGFVGALAGLGAALVLIGRYKDVLTPLTAVGAAAGAAAGGGGGSSSPIPLPGVNVTPSAPRTPMPMPRPSSAPGGGGPTGSLSIPATAKPVSHGSGRSGYYIPGYSEEPDDNDTLRKHVIATRVQVASLAAYVSQQGVTTDDSGAGGLAGFGGPLRRLGAPMGDGPGGGPPGGGPGRSPRRSRGEPAGSGPPGGAPRGSAGDGSPEALAADRQKYAEQMKDPAIRARMLTLAVQEVGHNPRDIQQFMETIFNRASARGQTLLQAMQTRQAVPLGPNAGQYPRLGDPNRVTAADQKAFDEQAVPGILSGSDYSNRSTGNASGPVNRSYPTRARSSRDERYVLETDRRDERWHKGIPTKTPTPNQVPTATPDAKSAPPPPQREGAWPAPVSGTSGPGGQLGDPRGNYPGRRAGPHMGQDVMAPQGTPVFAQFGGTVVRGPYTSASAAGNAIVIKYDNGYEVRFYHLSAFANLKEGQRVNAGDVVAYVGKTGAGGRPLRSDPHLHWEVRDPSGKVVDPNVVLGNANEPRKRTTQIGGPTEQDKQKKAQDDFDEYLRKQKQREDDEATPGQRGDLNTKSRPGIKLTLNLKGPRGVKATVGDSSGDINTKIERTIDSNVMRNVA